MHGNMRARSRLLLAALAIAAADPIGLRAQTPAAAGQYADPGVCATCHHDIAASYHKSGMGRSFYRLTSATAVEDFTAGKPFYHEASRSYFAMIER